ncbi:hypothetical protein J6590_028321 [Homalodisca vitripennis]|nr:hypothetical protein J6590_028321 [Homalodisca vitripennis]
MAASSKMSDFGSVLDIVQVHILAVTLAIFNRIDLLIMFEKILEQASGSEDGKDKAYKEIEPYITKTTL